MRVVGLAEMAYKMRRFAVIAAADGMDKPLDEVTQGPMSGHARRIDALRERDRIGEQRQVGRHGDVDEIKRRLGFTEQNAYENVPAAG